MSLLMGASVFTVMLDFHVSRWYCVVTVTTRITVIHMTFKAGRAVKPISVRLPDQLREQLDKEAERSGRTRNAEVIFRLAKSFRVKPAQAKR